MPELLIASIPSPSRGVIDVGPLPLHAYGLCLAIGILVAAKIGERRWARMGGDPAVVGEIGLVTVLAGVVGARVYHLFTGYDWDEGGLAGTVRIWEGGLSIWGAVAGGAIAVVVLTRRRGIDSLAMCDALAPAVAVAQAIGRWGNWFNQELFGKPTDLPWALEIDPEHRPAGYELSETFHPTFLYESLWLLALAGFLMWSERRFRFRRGQTLAGYVALYTGFRVLMEWLRIDPATKVFGGLRWNGLMSAALCLLAAAAFVALGRRGRPGDAPVVVDEARNDGEAEEDEEGDVGHIDADEPSPPGDDADPDDHAPARIDEA